MKPLTTAMIIMMFAMGMPMAAVAMSHGEHAKNGQQMSGDMQHHGDMEHNDSGMHKGHDMDMMADDDFTEIGKETQDGVVATVKIKTYDEETKAKMTKMGMDATHHVMVFFTDEKSGKPIAGGKAAVKVKGSDDSSAKPVMMMSMGDGFGGDITVKEMGMYTFEIGTKLEDGKKRQFEVEFHNM